MSKPTRACLSRWCLCLWYVYKYVYRLSLWQCTDMGSYLFMAWCPLSVRDSTFHLSAHTHHFCSTFRGRSNSPTDMSQTLSLHSSETTGNRRLPAWVWNHSWWRPHHNAKLTLTEEGLAVICMFFPSKHEHSDLRLLPFHSFPCHPLTFQTISIRHPTRLRQFIHFNPIKLPSHIWTRP